MNRRLILLSLLLLCARLSAQTLTAMQGVVSDSYNFWLYEPSFDSVAGDKAPLVVFLHGKSLSGTDLNRVRRYGTLKAIERGMPLNAYVLAPQTSNGWNPERIWRLVEWAKAHRSVDTNRIYVIGMSMGGYGTIDLSCAYSDRIAASMAICGGGNARSYCGLCDMPLWILHGLADRAVPVRASDKVVAAMRRCGDVSRLRYTKLQGHTHSSIARVLYRREAYDWLLSHSLQDPGRAVNDAIVINEATLASAYYPESYAKGTVKVNGATGSSSGSKTAGSAATYYKVKQGDTLGKIAQRNGTTVKKLCQLNNIKESSILRVGQKLRLK